MSLKRGLRICILTDPFPFLARGFSRRISALVYIYRVSHL